MFAAPRAQCRLRGFVAAQLCMNSLDDTHLFPLVLHSLPVGMALPEARFTVWVLALRTQPTGYHHLTLHTQDLGKRGGGSPCNLVSGYEHSMAVASKTE